MITELLSGKRGFASDNCSGVHPAIIEALTAANTGHTMSYGDDELTAAADKAFCELFGRKVYPFLMMNGTGANCALLAHLTPRFGGIVCTDCAHINTHETGAPERIVNAKLYAQTTAPICIDGGVLPNAQSKIGKLLPEQIEKTTSMIEDEHCAQPSVVSLTQITELGTIYKPDEISELSAVAHKHGMKVAMDGARLANAAAALNLPVSAFTCDAGVDALVFGGTKNAMLFGEAIVFFDEELARGFKYTRKGTGQLSSKMRFVAAQFLAMLKDGLWLETAKHANDMAKALADGLTSAGLGVLKPDANLVYADMDDSLAETMRSEYAFHKMEGLWRFVTSFDTQIEEVNALIKLADSSYRRAQ